MNTKYQVNNFIFENMKRMGGPLLILIIILIVSSVFVPSFFTTVNIINIVLQSAIYIVISIGMTFVITGGGIDLSVGSQIALISVVMAGLIQASGLPVLLAMVVALVLGVILGLVNGLLIANIKVPDFIATLATMQTFRGLALVHSAGKIWYNLPPTLRYLGKARWFGMPISAIIALIIALIASQIYGKTHFGRYTIAIGSNPNASMLAGIPVRKYKILQYTLMGFLCGIAAILLTARLDSAQATMAQGSEIHAIAAVVMGGTSLFGGKGNISGTVVGALILTIISNTMVLLGVNYFWRLVATGIIIVVAVTINSWREMQAMEFLELGKKQK